jgi:FG-GAP repeat
MCIQRLRMNSDEVFSRDSIHHLRTNGGSAMSRTATVSVNARRQVGMPRIVSVLGGVWRRGSEIAVLLTLSIVLRGEGAPGDPHPTLGTSGTVVSNSGDVEGRVRLEVAMREAASPVIIDSLLTEEAKLTASDPAKGDGFGRTVALSVDGRTALVGTENAACPTDGDDCGAAYVFIREKGGTWVEQQKLTASDAAPFSNFGHSVALSADGKTALIGAPFAGPPAAACPALNCGAGYVFVRRGSQWVEQQKLTGSDAGIGATFGSSVALSADGKTALIGAINVACPTGANACGAAYVFVCEKGGVWIEQQKLTASDASMGDEFGSSVALSADGKTALIGVFFADCPAGDDCGAAYVFIHDKGGAWVEQQKLTASDVAANAAFGVSVSLSSGGEIALIGAPGDFCPSGPEVLLCGAAYVFVRKGGRWVEQQKLTVSNALGGGVFGNSVALAAGGRTALIGDRDAECPAVGGECGAAYVFVRKRGRWVEQQKLTASDAALADSFGGSVALSAGGRTALVGTDNAFCPASPHCGAAYVFRAQKHDQHAHAGEHPPQPE